ncbi:AMIN domain-containing protein [Helicobacter burdigaliensis]|uniref:AMIN domain-containing protein n=1 Tax=Helicobacter burdigaliensis TaxID=2315334 RepID=UPI000EF74FB5|nr:AMIN domain-containing protein [Helicobacter burdigaliensis]
MKKSILLTSLFTLAFAVEPKVLPEVPPIVLENNTTKKQTATENMAPIEISTQNTTSSKEASQETASKERNPFTPLITPKESGLISNQPELSLFTKTQIQLPSTARKITKITLTYQNLDGSLSNIEQELSGDIDWHFPLILSQEVQPKVQTPPKVDFTLGKDFSVHINKNTIKIKTKYKLLRDFTLASPMRLILDFKNKNGLPQKSKFTTKLPIVTKGTLQNHLDFYRISLMLDGQYSYNLKTTKEGLEIELN